jgi:TonB family protein
MKLWPAFALSFALFGVSSVSGQSGRRNAKAPATSPPAVEEATPTPSPQPERAKPQIAVVRNEEYKCTDDGSFVIMVEPSAAAKPLAPNEVTTKAVIRSKPKPEYTKEASRRAVQGVVTVRAVLGADGKVSAVTILKGLPFGLNESALHAACKIEFTPAIKDGQAVSQWLKTDFTFRLESSIFRP